MQPATSILRNREFVLFLLGRFWITCAYYMFILAISQFIYEKTHDPLYLGYLGLVLFIPRFCFILLAGHVADHFDRRLVMLISRTGMLFVVSALTIALLWHLSIGVIYALLFLAGTANAFGGPAMQALVTQLIPAKDFSKAVTWNTATFQLSVILGPALGGWLYAWFGEAVSVFYVVAILQFMAIVVLWFIQPKRDHIKDSEFSWTTILGGLRYVFNKRMILGAISLDLFAVLLGGTVSLLPIYANDILRVGPSGLGLLRAAPSLGALFIAIALIYLPPLKKSGQTMLWCVAIFGVATILFGISRHFIFSLFCLVLLGAADAIGVVIRGVLVQMETPPEMRGRVSAVNLVFIGASNELGEFESGVTARWFGTVPAVLIGGLGTLAVVGLWAWRFPELRRYS